MTRKSTIGMPPLGHFSFRTDAAPPRSIEILLFSGKLSERERRIWWMVNCLPRGKFFATNAYVASQIGVTPMRVSQLISKLVKDGLLQSVIDRDGHRTLYAITPNGQEAELDGGYMGAYTPGISSHIPIKQQVLSIKKTLSPPEAGDKELSSNPQHLPPTQESPPANQKPTRAVPATDFDAECVKKLRTIIAPATTAKYSSTAWKDEFRILRQTRTEQEIHSALEHYQKIFGREYTPQILSAKSFRLKFPQLVEAVKREEKRNPAVIVDPKLANCIARLKVLGWPKVASEKLPAACQISYDNFRAFQKKLDNPPPKDKHLADFLKYVRGHYLSGGGPVSFAEGWMRAAHGRVANWADWSGNVLALAFSEDSKEFRAEGHSIANKWGRGTDLWDRLMEELRDG